MTSYSNILLCFIFVIVQQSVISCCETHSTQNSWILSEVLHITVCHFYHIHYFVFFQVMRITRLDFLRGHLPPILLNPGLLLMKTLAPKHVKYVSLALCSVYFIERKEMVHYNIFSIWWITYHLHFYSICYHNNEYNKCFILVRAALCRRCLTAVGHYFR